MSVILSTQQRDALSQVKAWEKMPFSESPAKIPSVGVDC